MKKPSSSLRSFLLLCSLFGLPSCGDPREEPLAAAGLAEQAASLEQAKTHVEGEMKRLRADFEKRQGEAILKYDTLAKSNDSLRSQLESAQDEAAETRAALRAYRARYKASLRSKAKGLALPRLVTTDGKVFESVEVRDLTPVEVAISHPGGVTRVLLAKLSPELQTRLLYDPEEVEGVKVAQAASADAIAALKEMVDVKMRDPTRSVDAATVRTLTSRILSREAEIRSAENEAQEVKASPYSATNIAQYRIAHLEGRVAQRRNDIDALRGLLDMEINGPQSAGGPSDR